MSLTMIPLENNSGLFKRGPLEETNTPINSGIFDFDQKKRTNEPKGENSAMKPLLFRSDSSANNEEDLFDRICLKKSVSRETGDRFIPTKVAVNLYSLFLNDQSSRGIEGTPGTTSANSRSLQSFTDIYQDTFGGDTPSDSTPGASASLTREEVQNQNYFNLLQNQILEENENGEESSQGNMHERGSEASSKEGFHFGSQKKKLFKFKTEQKKQRTPSENDFAAFSCSPLGLRGESSSELSETQNTRKISRDPFKVLEAPCLQDDFYLNLLDWSVNNYIAVGLENSAFVWSASNSNVTKVFETRDINDSVCSVSWSCRGNHLAVGNNFGEVQIIDLVKFASVRGYKNHKYRVGSIGWNGTTIATGSRDRSIFLSDLRSPTQNICNFQGHKQEICGLKWSFDEQILASGGNDNKLFLWSLKTQKELARFHQHTAAVKAIGFSPHQHSLLASGGGTADRCIRFWNTHTLEMVDCVDTGSQVCNLVFSKTSNEIVSTHGYSLNQIIVWKYPAMQKLAAFTAHTYRVLNLALSPCGQNIVTGSGDETLKFWNIFPPSKREQGNKFGKSFLFPSSMDLR